MLPKIKGCLVGRTPEDHRCHLRIAMSRETISIAAVFLGSLSALPARICSSIRLHQLSPQVQRMSGSAPPTAKASTKSPNKAIVSRHLQGDSLSSRKAVRLHLPQTSHRRLASSLKSSVHWCCMNKIQYLICFLPIYLLTYSLIYRYWICHTNV